MPVIEHWHTHLNFPQAHPLHLGYDSAALVRDADVVLVLESDAPWFPREVEPPQHATVIQLDADPLYQRYPFRGFPTDISLTGSARLILQQLVNAIRGTGIDPACVRERTAKWSREHERQRTDWRRAAEGDARRTPMHSRWVSRCVGEALGPADIAITEYVLDPTQTCFTTPGSFFNHSHAAGLGWATGAALGAKLARPEATVVCCVGDGAYNFGVPVSTHYMSSTNNLPVLFVVYNNAAWGKSRKAAAAFAPGGWAASSESVPLCELGPSPEYHRICEAAGGYGELVEDPAELPAALERALQVVKREGRQALLNVRTSRD
jgi:acetolactate synthase-1/2/3 large subunit